MALKLNSRDIYAMMNGEHPDFPKGLDTNLTHFAYNALDSAVTLRVWERLRPLVDASPHATTSYNFVRAMQGPALDMMRTGIAVNQKVRSDETLRYQAIREKAQGLLDTLANAVWGPESYTVVEKSLEVFCPMGKRGPLSPRTRVVKTEHTAERPRGLNPNSSTQVLAFFNIALGCVPQYEIRKTPQGTIRTPTANDKALRKWSEGRTKGPGISPRDRSVFPVKLAAPFVSLILTIRDADKMLAVLRSPLDPDGRMRCSYNVVGTENGRWSSSKNAFGRGTNLQNVTPTMRRMFCADDGTIMVSTDLEQAESRLVAGLVWQSTGDDTYWNACTSSDLHTTVVQMAWPELNWSSNDFLANRKIAEQPCPDIHTYTYRDVAKRLGHGSNYRGSPFGIAQAVGIPSNIVEDFQRRYFRAFPAIPSWHDATSSKLRADQHLDTPLGRRRWFFGRPTEDSTLREAIAFSPQSSVGELLNLIMLRVWLRSKLPQDHPNHLPLTLLLQNHDAFAFQTPLTSHLPTIISEVNHEFNSAPIQFTRGGERRSMTIPGEFVTGFNWAYTDPKQDHFADGNVDGLRKWTGADARVRVQGARAVPADWLSRPAARTW